MNEYLQELYDEIVQLFDKKDLKFEILVITNTYGKIDDEASVGVRVKHTPTGIMVESTNHHSQVKNALIALVRLKKKTKTFTLRPNSIFLLQKMSLYRLFFSV